MPTDILAGTSVTFGSFMPITIEEIIKLHPTSFGKTCGLDSIPSVIIKQQDKALTPFVTPFFNKSLPEEASWMLSREPPTLLP